MTPLLQNNNAFTLAELLIVVAVLGIMATVAMPSIAEAYDDIAIRAAGRSLVADINYIRNLAVTEGITYGISFDDDGYAAFAEDENGVRQRIIHPITHQPWQENFREKHVTIAPSLGDGTEICFDATGTPETFGTITLTCGSQTLTITIAAFTGRVSVSRAAE